MNRTVIGNALLILTLCLAASAASGQDCGNVTLTIKPEETPIAEGDLGEFDFLADWFDVEPFQWCWSQRVVGTIQGVWTFCGHEDLYIENPLGLDIHSEFPELWGNPGVIETKKGDLIYVMSYGLSVWDYGADPDFLFSWAGVTTFAGGTGAYADAWGWTADKTKKFPASYWAEVEGFLCVPD